MLSHVAKLIWNNRQNRLLLAGQILLSFLVLFGVFSYVFQKFESYRTPLGFNVGDTYLVQVELPTAVDTVSADRKEVFMRLRRELEGMPEVERASTLGFITPFSNNDWGWGEEHDGVRIWTRMFMADEHYADAAELEVARGRWFAPADTLNGQWQVVVNQAFLDENYGGSDMLDSTITFFETDELQGRQTKIIGVVDNFKYGSEFAEEQPTTFVPDAPWDLTHRDHFMQSVIVRVAPAAPASVEEDIFEAVAAVTGSRESTVTAFEQRRSVTSRRSWLPILLMLTIAGFLVANVALGLFGLLINAIAKRRGEIGLRKALGATGASITTQLTAEVTIVALIGLLAGAAIASQAVMLELLTLQTSDYLTFFTWGGIAAAALILILVVACALIPSSIAARIHPAVALREE